MLAVWYKFVNFGAGKSPGFTQRRRTLLVLTIESFYDSGSQMATVGVFLRQKKRGNDVIIFVH